MNSFIYHMDLEKQEILRDCSVLVTVTRLWHVAQWVSRAPPQPTLPTFLNLNDIIGQRFGEKFFDAVVILILAKRWKFFFNKTRLSALKSCRVALKFSAFCMCRYFPTYPKNGVDASQVPKKKKFSSFIKRYFSEIIFSKFARFSVGRCYLCHPVLVQT